MAEAEFPATLRACLTTLKESGVAEARDAAAIIENCMADMDEEWADIAKERADVEQEAKRMEGDNERFAMAKACDGIERMQQVVEQAIMPFREESMFLASAVKENAYYCLQVSRQLKELAAAVAEFPRRANGTRGSGRSPRTGPSAQRPTRASGKTSPSRSATGKPSRSSGSGASPKTPRKATARPKRTARKTPRTG